MPGKDSAKGWLLLTLGSQHRTHTELQNSSWGTCGFRKPLTRIRWNKNQHETEWTDRVWKINKKKLRVSDFSTDSNWGELKCLLLCLKSATKHHLLSILQHPGSNRIDFSGLGIQPGPLYSITDLCPQFLKYNIYLVVFIPWTCHVRNIDGHVYVFPHLNLLNNNKFTSYVSFIGSDLPSSPNSPW